MAISSLPWWNTSEERKKILDVNYYKHSRASLCLVLPPVGSARSAILVLECIEHFIGSALFSNPEIQIQVCSPGRLDARRSALLAIRFYLGSDTLRRYTLGDLATSFCGRPTLSARGNVWCSTMQRGTSTEVLIGGRIGEASRRGAPTAIRKRPQRSAHGQRQQVGYREHLTRYPSRPCSVPRLLEPSRDAVSGGDGSVARSP
jgi:hypothetical protein